MSRALPWIAASMAAIGQAEVKGSAHNPWIVKLWQLIKRGGIQDDETPWCAAFVGGMLEQCGIKSTRFESAASYLSFGEPVDFPAYGSIAVLARPGGNHVAFVVGHDRSTGMVALLGGNQGDKVCVAQFPAVAVRAYRWPSGTDYKPEPCVVKATGAKMGSMQ